METVEGPAIGHQARPHSPSGSNRWRRDGSSSNTSQTVLPGISGWGWTLARATHWSSSQSLSSAMLFTRTRGTNSRSRVVPTWFSTWPFSQPAAGVQGRPSRHHRFEPDGRRIDEIMAAHLQE